MRRAALQRGAALLTAMLIVTLVASLAGAMVWRQHLAVQIEAAERARSQSGWILRGALDWARLILREDARANRNEPVDHLGEVWAVPLAEARLSTFLATDRDNNAGDADAGPEAFLSGQIADAQSRYNLHLLLGGSELPPLELRTLQRLCESAGLGADVATRLAVGLRAAHADGEGGESGSIKSGGKDSSSATALPPQTLAQLAWLGLPDEAIARLAPLVVLLPEPTPVNLNTAPREVIAALFDGMDLAAAERLVRAREATPLRNLEEAKAQLPPNLVISAERASVASNYFWVSGRLRLEQRVLEEQSLVRRRDLEMQVVSRRRTALAAS